MCNPASFIINRRYKIWYSLKTDSHSAICQEFGIKEDRTGANSVDHTNIIKVEINPPTVDNYWNFRAPLKEWVFKIDEERIPDWCDTVKCEKIARKVLKEWFAKKVVFDDNVEVKEGNVYILGQNATLRENATATLRENATATLRENATATLWGNATATLWENATATLWGNATATLWENATATLWENATATLNERSVAIYRKDYYAKPIIKVAT